MRVLGWYSVLAVLPLTMAACASAPRSIGSAELAARVAEHESLALAQRHAIATRVLRRLEYRYAEQLDNGRGQEPITFDILMLSSGGQFGAFGVGVLQGWATVEDEAGRRPEFDLVTGVSTGALIAPFGLLGTDNDIRRIGQLYSEADDTLAILRGLLFFLPWQPSFFDNRPLAERIKIEVDETTVRGLAAAHAEHRLLLIGSTDLDLGRFRMWDIGPKAREAHENGDFARLHDILLSSAAIPAAFPPVEIDGTLFVDGAAAQAAFVGLDREELVEAFRAFAARHPDAPMPTVRFWMIVNGYLDVSPELVEQRWIPVAGRSAAVLTSYAMRTTLRHMQFGVELIGHDLGVPAEFRYLAVPADLALPPSGSRLFDRQVMTILAEVGHALGAAGDAWQTEAAAPEVPGSAIQLQRLLFDD
jgi:hypothetical protein